MYVPTCTPSLNRVTICLIVFVLHMVITKLQYLTFSYKFQYAIDYQLRSIFGVAENNFASFRHNVCYFGLPFISYQQPRSNITVSFTNIPTNFTTKTCNICINITKKKSRTILSYLEQGRTLFCCHKLSSITRLNLKYDQQKLDRKTNCFYCNMKVNDFSCIIVITW